ncbi:Probable transcription repressor NiaR [uncultured Roseburia sp.]|uniref:Transcription repressor NadR n=1 Tax=Brotonthovivens ammoniilytica TaxID=2981725 RepID=A0ABT2TK28_9FIRM|nr:transcription repressor NadR [Brotonthovivens ammoniilytica]MCU6762565.1 transcription repressor NadR [Brotonthovivens ammoniilytica]SCI75827.1 Probable transcription repressor NiaR [uncultured Roseburia sp.]
MAEGETRRLNIMRMLSKAQHPLSGSELAKEFGVSRQVIVQDIALLRAVDKNILSTNKGYLLYEPETANTKVKRSFAVCHTDEQMADELYTIIDYGGTVLDVVVEHEIYGQITVDLLLRKRADINEFLKKIEQVFAKPLKELTNGNHFHTVEADNEQTLEEIQRQLSKKGFLVEL